MICEIVTPDRLLFSGEAEFVSAPAAEGEIGVMYRCAPIMSTLKRGEVRVKATMDSEPSRFAVDGGYVEVDGRRVVVLASHAMDVAEVDVDMARERIAVNEKRLAEIKDDDSRAAFYKQEIAWQNHLIKLSQK
jgi:F-type H+-transporting ATPase subunit epsilon